MLPSHVSCWIIQNWPEVGDRFDHHAHVLPGGPVEEAQVLLEDHIIKSQAMATSPFSKPFEDRLVPWEKKLQRFQVNTPRSWVTTEDGGGGGRAQLNW